LNSEFAVLIYKQNYVSRVSDSSEMPLRIMLLSDFLRMLTFGLVLMI